MAKTPATADDLRTEKEKAPPMKAATVKQLGKGEHLPGRNFREAVEGTKVEPLDIPATEPYPTGNPPDPAAIFERIYGHKKVEG